LRCRALKEALEKEAKDRESEARQLRNLINDNAKAGYRILFQIVHTFYS
jgi:hypothetical protein